MWFFGSKTSQESKDSGQAQGITTGAVIRYTHLPQILPRIRALGGKFGHFAYMLAIIYRSARLLPSGHPMLNPANIGRFGVRDVIATAANGLAMKRENMDQILVFVAVLLALVMVAIQAVIIAFYAFFNSAKAATPTSSMFETPNPNKDLAFGFLRNVFGVDGFFGSATTVEQSGLHAIMGFYSTAMMIIAVIIVMYYVVTVVGESAQSGTPFGRRFNGLWAPIRLVLALGLLVPLGNGLNAAQYAVLTIAKLGSGLATQAWITYTNNMVPPDHGTFKAPSPSIAKLGTAIFSSQACAAAINRAVSADQQIQVLAVSNDVSQVATYTSTDFTDKSEKVTYVWTSQKPPGKPSEAICGSVEVNLPKNTTTGGKFAAAETLRRDLVRSYLKAVGSLVRDLTPPAAEFATFMIATQNLNWAGSSASTPETISQTAAQKIDAAQDALNSDHRALVLDVGSPTSGLINEMKDSAREKGWAGAGIYFTQLGAGIQVVQDALNALPSPSKGAVGGKSVEDRSLVEWISSWFGVSSATEDARTVITGLPTMSGKIEGKISKFGIDFKGNDLPRGNHFDASAFSFDVLNFTSGLEYLPKKLAEYTFGEALIGLMNNTSTPSNQMEKLMGLGGNILNKSQTAAYAFFVLKLGGAAASAIPVVGDAAYYIANVLADAAWFFVTLGLVAGVMLFYVLPMMPFMYFFYSVVNWVIEVAEAFVSMPLFALAHLRIDGEGLPGQTAYNGYLTLFGVMIRPALIIVGFIVASLIFNAGSYYLIEIYKYAVFAARPDISAGASDIDLSKLSLMGLVMYVVLFVYVSYLLANSSFKLIDAIPDKALRWIGGQTPFTGDKPVDIGGFQGIAGGGIAAMMGARAIHNSLDSGIKGMIDKRKAMKDKKTDQEGLADMIRGNPKQSTNNGNNQGGQNP